MIPTGRSPGCRGSTWPGTSTVRAKTCCAAASACSSTGRRAKRVRRHAAHPPRLLPVWTANDTVWSEAGASTTNSFPPARPLRSRRLGVDQLLTGDLTTARGPRPITTACPTPCASLSTRSSRPLMLAPRSRPRQPLGRQPRFRSTDVPFSGSVGNADLANPLDRAALDGTIVNRFRPTGFLRRDVPGLSGLQPTTTRCR